MSLFAKSVLLFVFSFVLTSKVVHVHGVTVNITNHLGGNKDLTLHCKSSDDDLGVHPPKLTYGCWTENELAAEVFGAMVVQTHEAVRFDSAAQYILAAQIHDAESSHNFPYH
ncbi:hypothetical protein VNO78_15306 [Psophocarpus tetragonolobus]|uniref:S-protein homolog n=1 Tax=Psophocarpus tetragonolobus TaxID=3891 RepID=A0AAN9XJ35_PSOTE